MGGNEWLLTAIAISYKRIAFKNLMNTTQGFKICANIFHCYINKYLMDGAFQLYQYWPYAKSTYF